MGSKAAATVVDDDDAGPPVEFSTDYDPSSPNLKPSLSVKERSELRGMGRRQPTLEFEPELKPLSPVQRAATLGIALKATRSRIHGPGVEGLCISVNAAGSIAVIGTQDGKLVVVDSHTLKLMDTIDLTLKSAPNSKNSAEVTAGATTAVRYIPTSQGTTSSVVVAVQGSRILHIHISTGQCLSVLTEEGNKVYNVQMRPDGHGFASCGSDKAVRLYDQKTGQLYATLDHGDGSTTTGHGLDVFGLAWHNEDPNILISGGWDNTVQVWDVRLNRSVRSLFGPYVCGDSLDLKGNAILAGSWRHAQALELWDLRTCRLQTVMPFFQPEHDACKIYSAKFGKGTLDGYIVAGGSGLQPCVKLYHEAGDLIGTALTHSGVYSIDSVGLPQERFFSICCANEMLVMDMSHKKD